MSALPKDARACGGADPNRVGGQLTYAERKRARGMLADKQGVGSIAEELECSVAQVQALADAKPKAVRPAPPCSVPIALRPRSATHTHTHTHTQRERTQRSLQRVQRSWQGKE
jgi:hypothetical protein